MFEKSRDTKRNTSQQQYHPQRYTPRGSTVKRTFQDFGSRKNQLMNTNPTTSSVQRTNASLIDVNKFETLGKRSTWSSTFQQQQQRQKVPLPHFPAIDVDQKQSNAADDDDQGGMDGPPQSQPEKAAKTSATSRPSSVLEST